MEEEKQELKKIIELRKRRIKNISCNIIIMYCNKLIHHKLWDVICPFCYTQIKERSVIAVKCCDD